MVTQSQKNKIYLWVCDFALVKIFGHSQTISLVSRPKIFTNTKATPQILEFVLYINILSLRGDFSESPKQHYIFRHCEGDLSPEAIQKNKIRA